MENQSDLLLHDSFLKLQPHAYSKDPVHFPEEFEKYWKKISSDFKNIPKDAFIEWIYPFWHGHIKLLYGNLNFENLNFELTTWPTTKCLEIRWYSKHSRVEQVEEWDEKLFFKRYQGCPEILDIWRKEKTWLKPIWVLNSRTFSSTLLSNEVRMPYMLIEGHSRLGALRMFSKTYKTNTNHKVWLISYNST